MYSDTHRCILQYLMTAGSAAIPEVLNVYESCLEELPSQHGKSSEHLNRIITEINEAISPFNQEIRKGICEISGNKYFVFINTVSNELSKLQKEFKEKDLEYLKLIIEAIMSSDDKRVPEHVYLNIANKIPGNYSSNTAFELIQDLIWKTYFTELDNSISFGIRFIYECEPYLREEFKENICECTLCKELIFNGHKCVSCEVLFHKHCWQKYIARRNKCPNCESIMNLEKEPSEKRLKTSHIL